MGTVEGRDYSSICGKWKGKVYSGEQKKNRYRYSCLARLQKSNKSFEFFKNVESFTKQTTSILCFRAKFCYFSL